jgi:hypothetical protein
MFALSGMAEELDLQDRIGALLISGPATVASLAPKLRTTEAFVLAALNNLRREGFVESVDGKWSLTDEYKRKK